MIVRCTHWRCLLALVVALAASRSSAQPLTPGDAEAPRARRRGSHHASRSTSAEPAALIPEQGAVQPEQFGKTAGERGHEVHAHQVVSQPHLASQSGRDQTQEQTPPGGAAEEAVGSAAQTSSAKGTSARVADVHPHEAVAAADPVSSAAPERTSNATASTKLGKDEFLDPAAEWDRLWALKIFLPVCFLMVLIFEWYHRAYARVDWNLKVDCPQSLKTIEFHRFFVGATGWLQEYAQEPQDRTIRHALLAILVADRMFSSYMGLVWTMWIGRWMNLLQYPKGNFDAFWPLLGNFIVIVAVDTLKGVYVSYIKSWFMLDWHTWMTRRFQRLWLSSRTFYLMEMDAHREDGEEEVDNPDQRIAEDTIDFCNTTYRMTLGLFSTVIEMFIYVPMLWEISPRSFFGIVEVKGWLLYAVLVWSICGTYICHRVGRMLVALKYATQRYYADLRFSMAYVRTNGESIAMLGGEDVAKAKLDQDWARIRRVTWEWMAFQKRFSLVMGVYHHTEYFFSVVALVPAYLSGELTLGTLGVAKRALANVKSDLEYVIDCFDSLTTWRSAVSRLQAFEERFKVVSLNKAKADPAATAKNFAEDLATETVWSTAAKGLQNHDDGLRHGLRQRRTFFTGVPHRIGKDPMISANRKSGDILLSKIDKGFLGGGKAEGTNVVDVLGMMVFRPSGDLIVEVRERLLISPGDRILLSGPVGCGKSSLVRALSGIWPHADLAQGGHLRMPAKTDCVFVPRVPALPSGTLRDLITYPEGAGTYSDVDLIRAIEAVGLNHLMDRELSVATSPSAASQRSSVSPCRRAGLDATADWLKVLSGGEQQRAVLAHTLLRKPCFLFLDEATSSMSQAASLDLYRLLFEKLPQTAVVSISHDVQGMLPLHSKHYAVDPASKLLVPQAVEPSSG